MQPPYDFFRYIVLFFLVFISSISQSYPLPDFDNTPIDNRQAKTLLRTWEEKNLLLTDPLLLQYLKALQQRLANHTPRTQNIELVIVNDQAVNAFAAEGQVIGLNSGLLLAVDYEAELAAVLAHEMAHLHLEHLTRLQNDQSATPLLIVALVAATLLANNAEASQAALASGFAGLAQRQVSQIRRFEREADSIGLQILTAAGFPAEGMASFFDKMLKMQQENPNLAYLRTHPLSSERLANVVNRTKDSETAASFNNSLDFSLFQARLCAKSQQKDCRRLKDPQAQDYFEALQYVEQKKYRQAQEIFQRLLQSQVLPHLWWYLDYGQSLLADGQKNLALAQYTRAQTLYPNDKQAFFAYLRALLESQEWTQAQALLEKNKPRFYQDAEYYFLQARLYQKLGQKMQLHEALGDFYYLEGIPAEAALHWQNAQAQATLRSDQARLAAKIAQLSQKQQE
jgi:predicted Zn-dependent protease